LDVKIDFAYKIDKYCIRPLKMGLEKFRTIRKGIYLMRRLLDRRYICSTNKNWFYQI